jgi:predicted MPP superfamily phosphohydrolase
MTSRLRLLVFMPALVFAVAGAAVFVEAALHQSDKTKAASPMPQLPPLPETGELKPASDVTHFTFVVAGDNRPEQNGPTQPVITAQIIHDLKQYQPSFILWTGDVIYGKDPKKKLIEAEYKAFLKVAREAGAPIFNVPGNHEMNAAKNAPCPAMQALYQEHMVKELYGAFAYGNSRFVALNTDSLKKGANCKPPTKKYVNNGYVDKNQLASLDAYLKANHDAQHIFILMHRPMEPSKVKNGLDAESTKALKEIFAKHKNIAYVFAGHQHQYYNALTKDISPPPCVPSKEKRPYYLVSGGAGASLSGDKDDGDEDEDDETIPGAFYNYLVFEVKAHQVKATLVNCGKDPTKAQCQAQPSCGS